MKFARTPKRNVSSHINDNITRILTNNEILNRQNCRTQYVELAEENAKKRPNESGKNDRGYIYYNVDFKLLRRNQNLIDALVKKYQKTKKKLQILDDGAGKGNFLGGLKIEMKSRKVPIETTAVCISNNLSEINKKLIDKVIVGDAKNLNLNKKYDLITSYFGSVHYSIPEIRDEIIKKYAFSLNKNGMALLRFGHFKKEPGARDINWIKLLEKVGFSVTIKEDLADSSQITYAVLIERLR